MPLARMFSSCYSQRYSTDYGRHWHGVTFLNETVSQIQSLIADENNIFYLVVSKNETSVSLIELDFNLLIGE